MNLSVKPVNQSNYNAIINLKVKKTQEDFIETPKQCLEEAKTLSLWHPVGIYHNEILVGFAMYGLFPWEGNHGRVWLDRFLIDYHFQGKQYGKESLILLLSLLEKEYHCNEIYLSLYENNLAALSLYKKCGFQFNGELDTKGEKVMVRKNSVTK